MDMAKNKGMQLGRSAWLCLVASRDRPGKFVLFPKLCRPLVATVAWIPPSSTRHVSFCSSPTSGDRFAAATTLLAALLIWISHVARLIFPRAAFSSVGRSRVEVVLPLGSFLQVVSPSSLQRSSCFLCAGICSAEHEVWMPLLPSRVSGYQDVFIAHVPIAGLRTLLRRPRLVLRASPHGRTRRTFRARRMRTSRLLLKFRPSPTSNRHPIPHLQKETSTRSTRLYDCELY